MADIELLDEIVDWLGTLNSQDYERVVVLIDRLADVGLGSYAVLEKSWRWAVRDVICPRFERSAHHVLVCQGKLHRSSHHVSQAAHEREN